MPKHGLDERKQDHKNINRSKLQQKPLFLLAYKISFSYLFVILIAPGLVPKTSAAPDESHPLADAAKREQGKGISTGVKR